MQRAKRARAPARRVRASAVILFNVKLSRGFFSSFFFFITGTLSLGGGAQRHRLRHNRSSYITLARGMYRADLRPVRRRAAGGVRGDQRDLCRCASTNTEDLSNFTSIRSPIVKSFARGSRAPRDVRSSALSPLTFYPPSLFTEPLTQPQPSISREKSSKFSPYTEESLPGRSPSLFGVTQPRHPS